MKPINQILTLILLTFLFSCEEKQDLPKVIKPIDLTRELKLAKEDQFRFDEKKELVSHWKKNPGRFSGLTQTKKWLNTQITFNTDKKFFINHSQDSILLSPNGGQSPRFECAGQQCRYSKLDVALGCRFYLVPMQV